MNPFRIGGQNAASQGAAEVFHGAIDELRMYPRTLTDQEVIDLSQVGGQPQEVINVALIGDSITTGNYPAQLQTLLGPNYYINPYGAGGTTMLKNGDQLANQLGVCVRLCRHDRPLSRPRFAAVDQRLC